AHDAGVRRAAAVLAARGAPAQRRGRLRHHADDRALRGAGADEGLADRRVRGCAAGPHPGLADLDGHHLLRGAHRAPVRRRFHNGGARRRPYRQACRRHGACRLMTPELIGLLPTGLIFGLILLGMHIGVALAAVSFIGVYMITGRMSVAASLLQSTAYSGLADYAFAVIPLSVVMGLFAMRAGVVRDLFDAAETVTRRIHG